MQLFGSMRAKRGACIQTSWDCHINVNNGALSAIILHISEIYMKTGHAITCGNIKCEEGSRE